MKKKIFIIFTSLVLFILNHSVVSAKNTYFEDGKKLFEKKNIKTQRFILKKI